MEIYSKEHIDKFMNKINTKKLTIFGLSYCGYTEKAKTYAVIKFHINFMKLIKNIKIFLIYYQKLKILILILI